MSKVSLFETHLSLTSDYVVSMGEEIDKYEYVEPGSVFTMNYTQTIQYVSTDATVMATVVSVRTVVDDDWPEVWVLGCVLKLEVPIYVCEFGAHLAREIILLQNGTMVGSGYRKGLISRPYKRSN